MADHIFHTADLLSKRFIADQVLELRFTKPNGFTFQAGQFVQFRISDGQNHVLRSYSISSAPHQPYLEFCVKVLPDGKASQFFDQLPVGGTAELSQARGLFVIKPEANAHKVFIATGTGLAPIMSMLTTYTAAPVAAIQIDRLDVLFGVRSVADIFWLDRLEQFQVAGITIRTTISRPDTNWTGLSGRVTAHLATLDVAAEYYICGSLEMVKDVREILAAAGVSPKQQHFEIF